MTRLTVLQKSLWLGMLTFLLVAQAPLPEGLSSQFDQTLIPELQLIKEEETVSIASRYEQPISQAPSNVYVITDEDICHPGATDIPTVLRRVPGLDIMQVTGADFNVSARGDQDFVAKLAIAAKEARETGYWLRLIRETQPHNIQELTCLLTACDALKTMLNSIIMTTRSTLAAADSRVQLRTYNSEPRTQHSTLVEVVDSGLRTQHSELPDS